MAGASDCGIALAMLKTPRSRAAVSLLGSTSATSARQGGGADRGHDIGSDDAGDRDADAEEAGDQPTLVLRQLVGQDGDRRRQGGVEHELRQAPAHEHDADARRQGDDNEAQRAAEYADDQPRAAAAEARGGAV